MICLAPSHTHTASVPVSRGSPAARVIDLCDVPPVALEDLLVPMRAAIARGQGLALLNGLSETAIRDLEALIWDEIKCPEARIAVALRWRALLDVFRARRLKDIFLSNGFKLIARAVREASTQRLNADFGFSAQKFVFALTAPASARRPALAVVGNPQRDAAHARAA